MQTGSQACLTNIPCGSGSASWRLCSRGTSEPAKGFDAFGAGEGGARKGGRRMMDKEEEDEDGRAGRETMNDAVDEEG
eukprot:4718082-Pyramimonas_sp.AAC.1